MSAIKVGIVSLVVGAIGSVAILVSPSWFPVAASVQAKRQDDLYLALMITSSFIFSAVVVFLVYSMIAFRARPGDEDRDGPPIHGNTTLEIIWTVIPTIIVVVFAIAGGWVLIRNENRPADRLTVGVVGQQFEWTFVYHDHGATKVSTVLVLPINRTTEFDITSKIHDVIHSFYVPEFRVKADAVPGIINRTYATPTMTGHFLLECAELCGIGHSQMRAPVRVVSQAAFAAWLARLRPVASGGSA